MKFIKKLGYYLFGVSLGILVVWGIFGDREFQCSYFPNDRVLSDLRKKELRFSVRAQCQMRCMAIDTAAVKELLHTADVDFKKSDTESDSCRTYHLDGSTAAGLLALYIANCDSTAAVLQLERTPSASCACDTTQKETGDTRSPGV